MRLPMAHRRALMIVKAAAAPVGSNPGKTNLSAWWELGETGSADRNDSHTGGYHLSAVNSPGNEAGVVGNALTLASASSQYLNRAAALEVGANSMTLGCWVKTGTHASSYAIIGKVDVTSTNLQSYGLALWGAVEVPTFTCQNSTGGTAENGNGRVSSATEVCDGNWHLIVAGRAASTGGCWISVDGGAKETSTTTANISDWGWPFRIGSHMQDGYYLNGAVDQAFLYTGRELTDDEIDWMFNAGDGRAYSDLAA